MTCCTVGLKRSRAHGELQTAKKSKASSPAPEGTAGPSLAAATMLNLNL